MNDNDALIDRCASEPIATPGLVQSHGFLFVVSAKTLEIEQVSTNILQLFGCSPDEVIGKPLPDLLEESSRHYAGEVIRRAAYTYINPFSMTVMDSAGRTVTCNAIAHSIDDESTILELEPVALDKQRERGLDGYFQMVETSLASTSELDSVVEIAATMADQVKEFTGFDRVMVYRFAPDLHGEVIGEALEPGMEPFLNLHYPASDIPAQARALYLKNLVRLLYDVDADTVGLHPVQHPRYPAGLPMGKAVLRSLSPVHLQYLRNMGVCSTLTISLIVDGALWGLIACHHREPHFVPYEVRATSSFYGVMMSAQLARAERMNREKAVGAAHRGVAQLLQRLDERKSLGGQIVGELVGLCRLFEADGCAFVEDGAVSAYGACPEDALVTEVVAGLSKREPERVLVTAASFEEVPEMKGSVGEGAGLVAIPFATDTWLLLFKTEQSQSVIWGGDPSDKVAVDSTGQLTPRASFAQWKQEISGQSLPWPVHTDQVVDELMSGLSGFLVANTRYLEGLNEELEQFAGVIAHEVKSQLQSPTMALAMLREVEAVRSDRTLFEMATIGSDALETLSEFTTEMLNFSRINDPDDEQEDVDVEGLVHGLVQQIEQSMPGRNQRIKFKVHEIPRIKVSRHVLRHLLSNLIRNAVIHGPKEHPRELLVEIGCEESDGPLVLFVRDNGRGISEESHARIFDYFYRGHGARKRQGTGIGLGFVRKLLDRNGGRIWVESVPDQGATFRFILNQEPGV
ncbi:ATP-binding protein [Haloferula rosea]|uniref:histidine kinase n=1 Tax=Haloferula rosea TaxID=490093 RepID=A0A934R5G4_9BACT|nr:ATP-binding protein [Haloferula rosea]MBK1825659.1 GAF domain-containing protein [Haloferula rosea]